MKKLIIAATLVLAACAASTQAPIQAESGSQQPGTSASTAQTGGLTQAEIDARALAAQGSSAQAQDLQSVYFDYSAFNIKPGYSKVIEQQADFMKAHPDDVVTLQGNTDERGSDEFNLALGDTRANTVRKMMLVLGVPGSRIKTVSFGEEKPRLTCHDESCWKENRRVDFIHKTAK